MPTRRSISSDFAFAILGVVAERVTGRVFGELFEEFVRERLNMKSTSVIADPKMRAPISADGNRIYDFWKWEIQNPYIAGGGLVSNIEDMMSYLVLELTSKEKFITEAHKICQDSLSKSSNIATQNAMILRLTFSTSFLNFRLRLFWFFCRCSVLHKQMN